MAHCGFALVFGLLGCLLLSECAVFINQQKASSVLRQYRRYNSGRLAEVRQRIFLRECIEEICNFEEAREIFEDDAQMVAFWKTYNDVCSVDNGECNQICTNEQGGNASCSCVDGYHLLEDQKTCEPSGLVPCGKISSPEHIPISLPGTSPPQEWGVFNSLKGEVPWQVYMFSFDTKAVCEGVLISDKWVITAAHCLEYEPHTIVAGEYNTTALEPSEQLRQIFRAVLHPSYNETTKYENDLALLELSTPLVLNKYVTPICIGNKRLMEYTLNHRTATLSGWWKIDVSQKISTILQHTDIQYVDQRKCLLKHEPQPSLNTFCAGHPTFVKRIYHGSSGASVATDWEGIWFLMGILTCGAECTGDNQYDLFTSIANHIEWIHNVTRGEK